MIAAHGGELDYDLMTRTRFTLADLGGRLSESALVHFVRNLPPSSVTARAESDDGGEAGTWEDPAMLPQLVAQLIDEVRLMQWYFVSAHSKRKVPQPEPFPRPGVGGRTRRYGSGAIPVAEFENWWNEVG